MGELTPEALKAMIDELSGRVGSVETLATNAISTAESAKKDAETAFTSATEAETKASSALSVANEAKSEAATALSAAYEAGKTVPGQLLTTVGGEAKVEKIELPTGSFEHEGKKYEFTRKKFRLAGDPALHIASEVAATAGQPDGTFAKVLKIEGQDILKEVV